MSITLFANACANEVFIIGFEFILIIDTSQTVKFVFNVLFVTSNYLSVKV